MSATIELIKHSWLIKFKWTYHTRQTRPPAEAAGSIVLRDSSARRQEPFHHNNNNNTKLTAHRFLCRTVD